MLKIGHFYIGFYVFIVIMELLLPAGDLEKLKIAVDYGADAVYCGMKQFNARGSAANFDYTELKKGITYAHEKGVRVYVVFNTLI